MPELTLIAENKEHGKSGPLQAEKNCSFLALRIGTKTNVPLDRPSKSGKRQDCYLP